MKAKSERKNLIEINAVGIVRHEGKAVTVTLEVAGEKFTLLLMEDLDTGENYFECYRFDEKGIFEEDYICDIEYAESDEELAALIQGESGAFQ